MAERIDGLADLRKAFERLDTDIRAKSARRIVAAGGAVLRKEARAIVERKQLIKTRALINNIVIKRQRNAGEGIEQYNLGVRHGRALGSGKKVTKYLAISGAGRVVVKRKEDPFYWRFLEFGHKIVPRNTSGSKSTITQRRRLATGFVPATPFIGPALSNKKNEALDAMEKMAAKLLVPK